MIKKIKLKKFFQTIEFVKWKVAFDIYYQTQLVKKAVNNSLISKLLSNSKVLNDIYEKNLKK